MAMYRRQSLPAIVWTSSAALLLMSSTLLLAQDPAESPVADDPAETPVRAERDAGPANQSPAQEPDQETPSDEVVDRPALPHPELLIGSTREGATSEDQWANFSFAADGPGLLTIVLRSQIQDTDMALALYNSEGQELANCDIDYLGDNGAEHLTVMIPGEGVYRIAVRPLGNGGAFWIGGSWIGYAGVASAGPARPSDAQALTPGTPIQVQFNGNNPPGAWFTFTPQKQGFMIVQTLANNGVDLQLDLYDEEQGFDNYLDASDQDRRGDMSREQISIELQPGKTYYFHAYDRSNSRQATQVTVTARIFVEQDAEPNAPQE